jgi:hypothetical protein
MCFLKISCFDLQRMVDLRPILNIIAILHRNNTIKLREQHMLSPTPPSFLSNDFLNAPISLTLTLSQATSRVLNRIIDSSNCGRAIYPDFFNVKIIWPQASRPSPLPAAIPVGNSLFKNSFSTISTACVSIGITSLILISAAYVSRWAMQKFSRMEKNKTPQALTSWGVDAKIVESMEVTGIQVGHRLMYRCEMTHKDGSKQAQMLSEAEFNKIKSLLADGHVIGYFLPPGSFRPNSKFSKSNERYPSFSHALSDTLDPLAIEQHNGAAAEHCKSCKEGREPPIGS